MEASLLVQKLNERGITLRVTDGELICKAGRPIPKAIMTTINAEKEQLIAFLKGAAVSAGQPVSDARDRDQPLSARTPDNVPRLPWQLEALLRAANSDALPKGMQHLESGLVFDLSTYALACAASYLIGDGEEALRRLWQAHHAWQGAN